MTEAKINHGKNLGVCIQLPRLINLDPILHLFIWGQQGRIPLMSRWVHKLGLNPVMSDNQNTYKALTLLMLLNIGWSHVDNLYSSVFSYIRTL